MAASALPIIALGMQGLSMIGQGLAARNQALEEAKRARVAQQVGEIQAEQADAQIRQNLNTTIHNIRAIAASSGRSVEDPSLEQYISGQEKISDQNRRATVDNIRLQAGSAGMDALAYQRAAKFSLLGGIASGLQSFAQIPGVIPHPAG